MSVPRNIQIAFEGRKIFKGAHGSVVTKETYILEPTDVQKQVAEVADIAYHERLPLPKGVDELISTDEAYRQTGIPVRELQFLARRGVILAKKINGRWQIDRRSLSNYLKKLSTR